MTLSRSSREGAFGLPNRPIHDGDIVYALKRAQALFRGGKVDQARWLVARSLCLEVAFSRRLVVSERDNKYPNSRVRKRLRWDVAPVWKCAPSTAYGRACRLSVLFERIAAFGSDANIAHDLVRMAINVWRLTSKAFAGLCRRIDRKLSEARTKTSPETALLSPELSANPGSLPENLAKACQQRSYNRTKYGVRHRPTCVGVAATLLSVKKRRRAPTGP